MGKKTVIIFITVCMTLVFLAGGCGPKTKAVTTEMKKGDEKSREIFFFPALPNTPRFQYLTTFSTSKDIEKKKGKFFRFVAGDEEEKPIPISKPYGVDIYNGIIYVCDVKDGVVKTLNLKDHVLGIIGSRGSGKLKKPANVFIDKVNQLLYVADVARKQVVVFNLKGNFRRAYGKLGEFAGPSDVALHGDRLYVCDVRGHRIHVLNRESGEILFSIGKAGSHEGEFYHPTNIDIQNDHLYVSDSTNFRFQIFTLDGEFIAAYGKAGRRPGNFARNKGIAVDKEGRIYVVDSAFQNVQVFNKEFKLLLYLLGPGNDPHSINLPAGIAIDYDNIQYFKKFISPQFDPEYLLFVTSNFGLNKVNVYAFGNYKGQK
jgi:DNA-binding beta-propeller fold protein YncE